MKSSGKNCFLCNKLKYGDVFIEKIPEGVVLCPNCSAKIEYEDLIKCNFTKTSNRFAIGKGWAIGRYGKGLYKQDDLDKMSDGTILKDDILDEFTY